MSPFEITALDEILVEGINAGAILMGIGPKGIAIDDVPFRGGRGWPVATATAMLHTSPGLSG